MHCLREGVNKGKFTDNGDKNCNNLISLLCKADSETLFLLFKYQPTVDNNIK